MKWLSEIMLAISEEYGTEYSDTRMKMWAGMLKDYSEKQVKGALIKYMRSEQARFAPKVSDIITMIEGKAVDRKAAGEAAFQRVYNAIGSCGGSYASVVFDDPAIMYAISVMGGWIDFCGITDDEKPFRRRDFVSAYASYKNGMGYPAHLAGIHERDNTANGTGVEMSLTYIGDKSRAITVHNAGRSGGMDSISTEAMKAISEIGG